ncbi:hypothetical protein ES288_A03G085400v1 [Gossypium darwinii]|uniref:Uncharacterized protein n=1 Tax=Gossypium darwinii TaxID=34276 RepID=A0A5D2H2C3_GOSDA|nr:hypothetical protein ES288_A03G085400v1 [Gossypium darwinii]
MEGIPGDCNYWNSHLTGRTWCFDGLADLLEQM